MLPLNSFLTTASEFGDAHSRDRISQTRIETHSVIFDALASEYLHVNAITRVVSGNERRRGGEKPESIDGERKARSLTEEMQGESRE